MKKILSLLDGVLERIRRKEDEHTYTKLIEALVLTPANSITEFVGKLEDEHLFSGAAEILSEILIILIIINIIFHQIE